MARMKQTLLYIKGHLAGPSVGAHVCCKFQLSDPLFCPIQLMDIGRWSIGEFRSTANKRKPLILIIKKGKEEKKTH